MSNCFWICFEGIQNWTSIYQVLFWLREAVSANVMFSEGNYILGNMELKCKYSIWEHRKRNPGCSSLEKEVKMGPSLDEWGKFGKVKGKHYVNVGVESMSKTALSSLVAAFAWYWRGAGRILRWQINTVYGVEAH